MGAEPEPLEEEFVNIGLCFAWFSPFILPSSICLISCVRSFPSLSWFFLAICLFFFPPFLPVFLSRFFSSSLKTFGKRFWVRCRNISEGAVLSCDTCKKSQDGPWHYSVPCQFSYYSVVGPRLIDGRGVLGGFGGFGGGLITFLAARLTTSSLGLAATLSTLLLHRTLPHAINFFL